MKTNKSTERNVKQRKMNCTYAERGSQVRRAIEAELNKDIDSILSKNLKVLPELAGKPCDSM